MKMLQLTSLPVELVEYILINVGGDSFYFLERVCRQWRLILAAWRKRGYLAYILSHLQYGQKKTGVQSTLQAAPVRRVLVI